MHTTIKTRAYPAEVKSAAIKAWFDGFSDTRMRPLCSQPRFNEIPWYSLAARCAYAYTFCKTRTRLLRRVSEGKAQLPGSVYDPRLDDGN